MMDPENARLFDWMLKSLRFSSFCIFGVSNFDSCSSLASDLLRPSVRRGPLDGEFVREFLPVLGGLHPNALLLTELGPFWLDLFPLVGDPFFGLLTTSTTSGISVIVNKLPKDKFFKTGCAS